MNIVNVINFKIPIMNLVFSSLHSGYFWYTFSGFLFLYIVASHYFKAFLAN